jgi:hypothetical protein
MIAISLPKEKVIRTGWSEPVPTFPTLLFSLLLGHFHLLSQVVTHTQILRHSRGERYDHFETVRLTKGGPQLHISPTVSPIKDANGNIVGASHPV